MIRRKRIAFFCLLGIGLTSSLSGMQNPTRESPYMGVLYRSLFYGDRSIEQFPATALDEPLRVRWLSYLDSFRRFCSLLPDVSPTSDRTESYRNEKRRCMERAIVSLIEGKGIQSVAAEYAKKAVVYYEWEGMSEGPLAEAAFAEEYLREHADTILRPYLILFLAHRLRCAGEASLAEKNSEQKEKIDVRYRRYQEFLRQEKDPLIRAAALDLDGQKWIYLDSRETAGVFPGISIPWAVELAEKAVTERHLDTAGQFIRSVEWEYDDGKRLYPDGKKHRGHYWYIHWGWAVPRMGGELSLRIFMNGEILVERHGP